ncbi:MAG: hypothetical protein WC622_13315 [Pedobacter sp.]|jgi:hypothetical protein|uniref:hypothetical protein n=1 Tax=Pedobacter sp. TaxID=1411316 RepID=UPI003564D74B
MKNLITKLAVVLLFFALTSLKNKDDVGYVTLEVSYIQTMGGQATILNTDTYTYYYLNAVDTQDQIEVPYGNYELVSASTNSCSPPLISSVTTSTGYTNFTLDANNQSFGISASCY